MKSSKKNPLMLSCSNEKHLKKIPSLDASCIMLNLEDGVSKEQKPEALKLCAKYLDLYKDLDKFFVVRVNALDDGGVDEIKYLCKFKPDAIRVPKIRTKDDVKLAIEQLDGDIELHLSIETKESWANLAELKIDARVTTYYLGVLDLFADMNLSQSLINKDNPTMLYILSHFLITCKSVNINPVSFVYQEFKNLEQFTIWTELEKSMGYDSKGCISPSQVNLANKVFTKDLIQIDRAKKIIQLFEEKKEQGITGFVDDEYGFIDEPIYKGALALLRG